MTMLTLIFALPLVAAIGLALVPRNLSIVMRGVTIGVTFVTMLLAIVMFWQFNDATPDANGYRFSAHSVAGRRIVGHRLSLGVDGLNVGLV